MYQCNNLQCTIDSLPTNNDLFNFGDEISTISIADGEAKKIILRFLTGATVSSSQSFSSNNYPEYDYERSKKETPEHTSGYFVVWLFRKGTTLYQKWDGRNAAFSESSVDGIGFTGYEAITVPTGEAPPDDEITIRPTSDVALNKIGNAEFVKESLFKIVENNGTYYIVLNLTAFDANAGTGNADNPQSYGSAFTSVTGAFFGGAESTITTIN